MPVVGTGTRKSYETMYRAVEGPEQLPWHREAIPPLLRTAVERRRGGRALDLGCGTGVYSVFLAKHGFSVTAVDFVEKAVTLARERAADNGVVLDLVHADVLQWNATTTYDLIFDSGCLHSLPASALPRYKAQLLNWLAPDGEYVLVHFTRRHWLDWRPVGPRRRTQTQVRELFAPELKLEEYTVEEMKHVPFPVGPRVRLGHYRFRRASR